MNTDMTALSKNVGPLSALSKNSLSIRKVKVYGGVCVFGFDFEDA